MFFFRSAGALPVLMYHKVDGERSDALTVSTGQLEEQMRWLVDNGYRSITASDLIEAADGGPPLPARAVLITFDDAYENNLTLALPVLRRFGMTAVLFVPTAFIGGTNEWDGGGEPLMTVEQLKELVPTFELAPHSHRHASYETLAIDGIRADLGENISAFRESGLPWVPVFAYPYGGRPKNSGVKQEMTAALSAAGIRLAFRIGNRLNRLPFPDRYEIQRLHVRGDEDLARFARKLRFGKRFF